MADLKLTGDMKKRHQARVKKLKALEKEMDTIIKEGAKDFKKNVKKLKTK